MSKTKRIPLIILITIFSIWIVLYSIELIDNKINGEIYKKIDNYFEEITMANKTENAKICNKNSLLLLNGTLIAEIKENKALVKQTLEDKERFNITINACNANINDFSKVQIPKVNTSKQNEIIKCKEHLIISKMAVRDALILLSTCNEKCSKEIIKKCNKLMNKSGNEAILSLAYHHKAKDRLTVKNIISKPWAIFVEKQLSKAQKYVQIKEGL